ncbi:hypothetical protein SEA_MOOSEHEAD_61 [Gordonia phage Moosehead]|nr:hypothetical protein SEA_MOOSEHEAD_61 [Gordonia phage Moosehead]
MRADARQILDALADDPSLYNIERYRKWLGDGGPRTLLAELDRLQGHYSPDEVSDIRAISKNAQRDLVEVAESLKDERDAALAVIAKVREQATDVDLYGGHSGPSLARTILNIVGGE